MQVEEIETPALLIDLEILERNIATMREKLSGKKCGYRPHVKAHKSPFVAHKQLISGAIGLTCQTIEEAEAMVLSGADDILLTNMIVSAPKIKRLLNLMNHSRVAVTVDSAENAKMLALESQKTGKKMLEVVVEVNVGQNRTGVEPGRQALELAQFVNNQRGLHLSGLMGYEGHLQCSIPNFEERKAKCNEALSQLLKTRDMLVEAHIPVEMVTAGGTGTYNIASDVPGITEIQPGSYVTMDHRYRMIDTCGSDFGCSMSILSTVVSRPTSDRAIVDMGWKSVGIEYQIFGWQGMPIPKNVDGVSYSTGGDEHGILSLNHPSAELKIGERIEFIPSHCDTTLNLHGKFYGVRRGNVEVICPTVRR